MLDLELVAGVRNVNGSVYPCLNRAEQVNSKTQRKQSNVLLFLIALPLNK